MKTSRFLTFAPILAMCALLRPAMAEVHFSTLYTFDNTTSSGLTLDHDTLYGVAYGIPCDTFFQLTPPSDGGGEWTETTLYTFPGPPGGGGGPCFANPPIAGPGGGLYGLAIGGQYQNGFSFYELSPPASPGGVWTGSLLYNFSENSPPEYHLIPGPDGAFYLFGDPGAFDQGSIVQLN